MNAATRSHHCPTGRCRAQTRRIRYRPALTKSPMMELPKHSGFDADLGGSSCEDIGFSIWLLLAC